MTSDSTDIIILSFASYLATMGVAVTGLGMAIIYLFIWQISVIAGYNGEFKYAIFVQAIALMSVQVTIELILICSLNQIIEIPLIELFPHARTRSAAYLAASGDILTGPAQDLPSDKSKFQHTTIRELLVGLAMLLS